MARFVLKLLFFWGSLANSYAWAGESSLFAAHTGSCIYQASGPDAGPPALVNLCINGESHSDALYSHKGSLKQHGVHESTLYSGLSIGTKHSLLVSGRYYVHQDFSDGTLISRSLEAPYALYQFGKLYRDSLQFSLGKHVLPFGVERQPVLGFFTPFHPQYFWDGPDLGATLTLSNRSSLHLQLGALTETLDQDDGQSELAKAPQALTARLSYDRPSWQGSKAVLSLYGHREGERRLSLAILNTSLDDRVVQLEFIRSFIKGGFWSSGFRQLIRLYLTSPRRHGGQFFFLYDDIHHEHRYGSLGSRYFFNNNLTIQLAVSYRKIEITDEKQVQWSAIAGVGVYL